MKKMFKNKPTVSARIGLLIAHAVTEMGYSSKSLSTVAGFESAITADSDARIPLHIENQLWDEAEKTCNDADFGLHAAEFVRPGAFDVLDYAVRTAPTLGSALSRMVRYNSLLHDLAVFNVIDRSDTVTVEHHFGFADISPCRHASEFTLASLLVIGKQITGQSLNPLAVTFSHSKPVHLTEHLRIFGVKPVFGTATSSLTLPSSVLAYPIVSSDSGLSRIVIAHAEQLLAATARVMPDIRDTVRIYLEENFAQGPKTLAQVAQHMCMSERSLQRRLATNGTTFAKLLEDVRKELALRYIADRRLAIGEIAYLLGFAELSPFHRAFKRWTGMTPAIARQTHM